MPDSTLSFEDKCRAILAFAEQGRESDAIDAMRYVIREREHDRLMADAPLIDQILALPNVPRDRPTNLEREAA